MNDTRPSPFFTALPHPCIIVNANQRTERTGKAWERGEFFSDISIRSQSRQLGTVSLVGETYGGGLASVLRAKCDGCRAELASGGKRWECNVAAAVCGQMVTGGGYAPLPEAMSVLGVPASHVTRSPRPSLTIFHTGSNEAFPRHISYWKQ